MVILSLLSPASGGEVLAVYTVKGVYQCKVEEWSMRTSGGVSRSAACMVYGICLRLRG
jgi:hypothetical protein